MKRSGSVSSREAVTSETTLRRILAVAPIGIGVVKDRVFQWVNARFSEMVGYSAEELVGKDARIIYPSEVEYRFVGAKKYKQLRESGTGSVETKFRRRDGEVIDVLLSSTLLNPRDFSQGTVFTALDMTDRKKAEEALRQEKEKAQNYLDIAGVMIVALDSKGIVTLINRKGSEILGYPEEEIVGKNWFDHFVPGNTKKEVKDVFRRLTAGMLAPVEHYENPVLTRSGEERRIEWHNVYIRNEEGKIIGTLSSGTDVSGRLP